MEQHGNAKVRSCHCHPCLPSASIASKTCMSLVAVSFFIH